MGPTLLLDVVCHVRDKGEVPCTLDGTGQLSLEARRHSRYSPREDFALLVDEAFQQVEILVVDVLRVDACKSILVLCSVLCSGHE